MEFSPWATPATDDGQETEGSFTTHTSIGGGHDALSLGWSSSSAGPSVPAWPSPGLGGGFGGSVWGRGTGDDTLSAEIGTGNVTDTVDGFEDVGVVGGSSLESGGGFRFGELVGDDVGWGTTETVINDREDPSKIGGVPSFNLGEDTKEAEAGGEEGMKVPLDDASRLEQPDTARSTSPFSTGVRPSIEDDRFSPVHLAEPPADDAQPVLPPEPTKSDDEDEFGAFDSFTSLPSLTGHSTPTPKALDSSSDWNAWGSTAEQESTLSSQRASAKTWSAAGDGDGWEPNPEDAESVKKAEKGNDDADRAVDAWALQSREERSRRLIGISLMSAAALDSLKVSSRTFGREVFPVKDVDFAPPNPAVEVGLRGAFSHDNDLSGLIRILLSAPETAATPPQSSTSTSPPPTVTSPTNPSFSSPTSPTTDDSADPWASYPSESPTATTSPKGNSLPAHTRSSLSQIPDISPLPPFSSTKTSQSFVRSLEKTAIRSAEILKGTTSGINPHLRAVAAAAKKNGGMGVGLGGADGPNGTTNALWDIQSGLGVRHLHSEKEEDEFTRFASSTAQNDTSGGSRLFGFFGASGGSRSASGSHNPVPSDLNTPLAVFEGNKKMLEAERAKGTHSNSTTVPVSGQRKESVDPETPSRATSSSAMAMQRSESETGSTSSLPGTSSRPSSVPPSSAQKPKPASQDLTSARLSTDSAPAAAETASSPAAEPASAMSRFFGRFSRRTASSGSNPSSTAVGGSSTKGKEREWTAKDSEFLDGFGLGSGASASASAGVIPSTSNADPFANVAALTEERAEGEVDLFDARTKSGLLRMDQDERDALEAEFDLDKNLKVVEPGSSSRGTGDRAEVAGSAYDGFGGLMDDFLGSGKSNPVSSSLTVQSQRGSKPNTSIDPFDPLGEGLKPSPITISPLSKRIPAVIPPATRSSLSTISRPDSAASNRSSSASLPNLLLPPPPPPPSVPSVSKSNPISRPPSTVPIPSLPPPASSPHPVSARSSIDLAPPPRLPPKKPANLPGPGPQPPSVSAATGSDSLFDDFGDFESSPAPSQSQPIAQQSFPSFASLAPSPSSPSVIIPASTIPKSSSSTPQTKSDQATTTTTTTTTAAGVTGGSSMAYGGLSKNDLSFFESL